MKVFLIGCGCGRASFTAEAENALSDAELIIGPERLLSELPDEVNGIKKEAALPMDIAKAIHLFEGERVCVMLSGDSGFFSAARNLQPLLEGKELRILPGISSIQILAARLKRPWQDWRFCTAHGQACDPVWELCHGKPVFFLTDRNNSPDHICRRITEAGLGDLYVAVGENLGSDRERIVETTAKDIAMGQFSPLNVVLIEAAPRTAERGPGLPDDCFERADGIPMTKRMVRAAIPSLLEVKSDDVCWDIGTGTGSVGIELALVSKSVWGVEHSPVALRLAERNRRKLGAWNMHLIGGKAPEALAGLPVPNAVFVGGSGGELQRILQTVYTGSPAARICVSAVTLETLEMARRSMEQLGWQAEVTQLSVSRSLRTGNLTMMLAQNPVFLITGVPK